MNKTKILASAVLLAALLCGCTNEGKAFEALDNEGFTDIKFTGYQFFECGKDDTYHTGFTAKNSNGKTVTGTVCGGLLFKGSTIRY